MRWFFKKSDCTDDALRALLTDGTLPGKSVERILGCTYECIRRFVLDNSGTEADVADVVQETAIVLLQKLAFGSLEKIEHLSFYVCRVGKNIWVNELRRRKRNPAGSFEPERLPEPDADLAWLAAFLEASDDEENDRTVKTCFEKLGEKCRQLLWLHYVEGLSWDETIAVTGHKTRDVAKNQAVRCKAELRDCFSQNRYPNI